MYVYTALTCNFDTEEGFIRAGVVSSSSSCLVSVGWLVFLGATGGGSCCLGLNKGSSASSLVGEENRSSI